MHANSHRDKLLQTEPRTRPLSVQVCLRLFRSCPFVASVSSDPIPTALVNTTSESGRKGNRAGRVACENDLLPLELTDDSYESGSKDQSYGRKWWRYKDHHDPDRPIEHSAAPCVPVSKFTRIFTHLKWSSVSLPGRVVSYRIVTRVTMTPVFEMERKAYRAWHKRSRVWSCVVGGSFDWQCSSMRERLGAN